VREVNFQLPLVMFCKTFSHWSMELQDKTGIFTKSFRTPWNLFR